jgi:hypothetical protein
MSKHTRGPWHYDGRYVRAESRKTPICEVPMWGIVHSGVDRANARLIVAAPDLLRSLKSVLPIVEWSAKQLNT